MRLDRFTQAFQEAISDAQSIALGQNHQFIEPIHLMLALINQTNSAVIPLLKSAGIDVQSLRQQIKVAIDALAQVEGSGGDVRLSQTSIKTLNICDKLARKMSDKFIASELFVLAAIEQKGVLGQILKSLGADEKRLLAAIEHIRGGKSVDDTNAESTRQALEKYTVDLTERALDGKLDPVIGRDEEIRRTLQVLQRRTKNNPVLIGQPGVGKTAIAEGLAQNCK
jgi:ATP-dependent Clp protease ATP-binding subunit ClpB